MCVFFMLFASCKYVYKIKVDIKNILQPLPEAFRVPVVFEKNTNSVCFLAKVIYDTQSQTNLGDLRCVSPSPPLVFLSFLCPEMKLQKKKKIIQVQTNMINPINKYLRDLLCSRQKRFKRGLCCFNQVFSVLDQKKKEKFLF